MSTSGSAAFTCSFTRRTCTHASFFHDAYQRTNRTKGTKILRCFPHCCPRHVDRSYCGGPVYLQVDLVRGDDDAVEDDKLCVFAHFHPQAERGLGLGEQVQRDIFRPSQQQTDTNPVGEWIGARLVASADRTTWLFEVNPSGRWYYQWESGATKAQRSTEHLFEVYVLRLQPSRTKYQVVAHVSSPNFKMVSFRRAPTEKTTADTTATDLAPRPSLVSAPSSTPRARFFDDEEEKAPANRAVLHHRDSIDSAVSTDTGLASLAQTRASLHDNVAATPRRNEEERTYRYPESTLPSLEDPARAPLSLLPSADVVTISRQLQVIAELVQRVHSSALLSMLPEIQAFVLSRFSRGTSPDFDLSSLIALVAPLSSPRQPRRDHSSKLVCTALELALWILFDAELARIQENWLQHASTGLLEKVALYRSYYSWLESFQESIDAHLEANQTGETLAGLAGAAQRSLEAQGFFSPSPPQECWGLEAFVAQAREVFLASSGLGANPSRRYSAKRASEVAHCSSFQQRTPPSTTMEPLRFFVGSWQADISSIQWHPVGFNSTSSSIFASAFANLWSWRQFLAFNIAVAQFEDHRPPTTLEIASVWNASVEGSRCSRLVLDGKPRWLRVFPSGESTSSVLVGSQRVDHYIASIRHESNELLTNWYTWPISQGVEDTSCFCVRVSLRYQPAREGIADGLSVRVAVECGSLRRGVDVTVLGESSLTDKLQAVEQWTTLQSLQYDCRRQDPVN